MNPGEILSSEILSRGKPRSWADRRNSDIARRGMAGDFLGVLEVAALLERYRVIPLPRKEWQQMSTGRFAVARAV